ncbi:dehydrogenase [Photobacterium phosphoreum]|nr:dehydrogenase [Photobacterium phosphoreum]
MRLYETNYAKLLPLLPRSDDVGDVQVYLVCNDTYQLKIIESTRYTTVVTLGLVDNESVVDYLAPLLTVRLYHDAKVAEVCAVQQISRLKPIYDYPNLRMHQKNEKHQVNLFLGDWLKHCLRHGLSKQCVC